MPNASNLPVLLMCTGTGTGGLFRSRWSSQSEVVWIFLRLKSFGSQPKSRDTPPPPRRKGSGARNEPTRFCHDGSSSVHPQPDWLQMGGRGPAASGSRGCTKRGRTTAGAPFGLVAEALERTLLRSGAKGASPSVRKTAPGFSSRPATELCLPVWELVHSEPGTGQEPNDVLP